MARGTAVSQLLMRKAFEQTLAAPAAPGDVAATGGGAEAGGGLLASPLPGSAASVLIVEEPTEEKSRLLQ